MKRILRLSVILMTSCALPLFAQSDKEIKEIEAQVKKLDVEHANAVLRGDLDAMDKYWTKDFIVNNLFNEVDNADRIRRTCILPFVSARERSHQSTWQYGDHYEQENRSCKGKSPRAGETIYRRYTISG